MNTPKVAAALNTISLAFGELAEALSEAPQATRAVLGAPKGGVVGIVDFVEASPFIDIPDEPQGSLAVCPKHHVPYTDGTYGPYCKEITNDPAWGKQKGDRLWCRISPKNAADWLRINAA